MLPHSILRLKIPIASFSRLQSTSALKIIERIPISFDADSVVETDNLPTSSKRVLSVNRGERQIDNSFPPSLQYVRDVMDKYKDHVVLTQIGSFYELYFEHATKYAPKLNITLTSKELTSGRVPFAGFPVHQLNRHLKVLVKENSYSVAISDQFKNENAVNNDKHKISRRVTRIVTPGTFIDEAFENLQENQYLLNIEFPENCMQKLADPDMQVGLSWCDISTGELFVQQVFLKDLVSAITRIRPREILLEESVIQFEITNGEWYAELVELKKYFLNYQRIGSKHRTIQSFYKLFSSNEEGKELDILFDSFSQKELAAIRKILFYMEENLPDVNTNLELPKRQLSADIMQIDSRTSAALELNATMRENHKKGSLLSTIRRTVTPSGTRLLTQWLSAPSTNISEIQKRQQLVKIFKDNYQNTETVVKLLKLTSDMTRIVQKFSFRKGDAFELIQISNSLKHCNEISRNLRTNFEPNSKKLQKVIEILSNNLVFNNKIVDKVLGTLDEGLLIRKSKDQLNVDSDNIEDEKLSNVQRILKPSASRRLKSLHTTHSNLLSEKEQLLLWYNEIFREKLKIRNVALKRKQSGEFCIHLSGSPSSLQDLDSFINDQSKNVASFKTVQKSGQTRWISHEKWIELSQKLEATSLLIQNEEDRILNMFQDSFVSLSSEIRMVSQSLDYIDVLTSFSKLAIEQRLVLPKVTHGLELKIENGRHLVVEAGLSQRYMESFVANDCKLESGNLWVITGPNMGGKSTFLRQNAIIAILAQVGSFVPCDRAVIGIVDKIFSRVGSADDLYNEMSTFMVEMVETSFILKGATERSLAILDEIGRGTGRKEGIAIAFASLKYLVGKNKCRTLFATHFGQELSEYIKKSNNIEFSRRVSFYKSGIVGDDKSFFYDHKLKPGICSQSDAVKVAKLAGFPEEALDIAKSVLNEF